MEKNKIFDKDYKIVQEYDYVICIRETKVTNIYTYKEENIKFGQKFTMLKLLILPLIVLYVLRHLICYVI